MLSRIIRRLATKLLPPPNFVQPTTLDEHTRREIREWYQNPTTQLVLSLVENTHPGRNLPAMLPRSEADKDAAVCLLNRVYGWEQYRNTINNLLKPRSSVADVAETYAASE